ncbi:MAG: hypothetical protein ABSG95_15265 [Solirubrobacteraceae bacterium]
MVESYPMGVGKFRLRPKWPPPSGWQLRGKRVCEPVKTHSACGEFQLAGSTGPVQEPVCRKRDDLACRRAQLLGLCLKLA